MEGGRPTFPTEQQIPGASLASVGAGHIAIKLAGVLNTLSTETHLVVHQDHFLRTFDPIIYKTLSNWAKHTDIKIHKKSKDVKVEGTKGQTLTVHTDRGN
ncbi:hypothetical protein EW026_g6284 [Hermanssonia centrifuga]|uniref:Pyridine nucleotide-disulphide oxidoreductase N-terminal domain-containing protein n=1 Tax=Hermanssonia centrifuga TaxID=98765 RepID=A0A4S4KBS1_9APHY|nr:hypothetical protein EW026_g6284 [Hermanssonia centrifuga]